MGNCGRDGSRKERLLRLTYPICVWALAPKAQKKEGGAMLQKSCKRGKWQKDREQKKKAEPGAGIKMTEDEHQNDGRPASK